MKRVAHYLLQLGSRPETAGLWVKVSGVRDFGGKCPLKDEFMQSLLDVPHADPNAWRRDREVEK